MSADSVPYDSSGSACVSPAAISSLLYSAEAVVLTLAKRAVAESVDTNVTLTIGGNEIRSNMQWTLTSANAAVPDAELLLPPWLAAPHRDLRHAQDC